MDTRAPTCVECNTTIMRTVTRTWLEVQLVLRLTSMYMCKVSCASASTYLVCLASTYLVCLAPRIYMCLAPTYLVCLAPQSSPCISLNQAPFKQVKHVSRQCSTFQGKYYLASYVVAENGVGVLGGDGTEGGREDQTRSGEKVGKGVSRRGVSSGGGGVFGFICASKNSSCRCEWSGSVYVCVRAEYVRVRMCVRVCVCVLKKAVHGQQDATDNMSKDCSQKIALITTSCQNVQLKRCHSEHANHNTRRTH